MSTRLKHIKKLNSVENPNTTQIMFSFIFGDDMPNPYDPKKVYMKGDMITKVDNVKNVIDVLVCLEDNTTGTFDLTKWKVVSLQDLIKDTTIGGFDSKEVVLISETQPTNENNQMWLTPIHHRDIDTDHIDCGQTIIVFDGHEFSGQDDEPESPDTKVWFDYEFAPVE